MIAAVMMGAQDPGRRAQKNIKRQTSNIKHQTLATAPCHVIAEGDDGSPKDVDGSNFAPGLRGK